MLRFLEGRERTVPALLARGAERNGERPALRLGDETVSYAAIHDDARRLAAGLAEIGVRHGDHVAILLDNTLFSGDVSKPSENYETVVALRELNDTLIADDRVQVAMVPFADGVTFVRKLP